MYICIRLIACSNNTNKLSPQELIRWNRNNSMCSNNTNKLSPQELELHSFYNVFVQIIQINLVLKNGLAQITHVVGFK